jgi:hypothetical protein
MTQTLAVLTARVRRALSPITEDKDFGQLVYSEGKATAGVLLLRFSAPARAVMARSVVELVKQQGPRLTGRFVVVQPGRVRIGGLRRSRD